MHPTLLFPLVVFVVLAVVLWWVIYEPKRRLSLMSLLVLITLLAVALALRRWQPREPLEVKPSAKPSFGHPSAK